MHTSARRKSRYAIGRWCVRESASQRVPSVRVIAGEIQEVHAGEDDEEAAKQRDGVNGGRGVKTLEKKERGNKRAGSECDIIERIHAIGLLAASTPLVGTCIHIRRELAQGLVEVVHLGEDTADNHNHEDVS